MQRFEWFSRRCFRALHPLCEDWTGADAVHLLQRYRDEYCIYGDDVQGTADIVLTGMINAAKLGEADEGRRATCSLPGAGPYRHGPRARFRDRRW